MGILVIEGNEDDIELTVHALRTNGVLDDVHVAQNGRAALDFLHRPRYMGSSPKDQLRLILLELDVPEVSGLDLLRAIKASPHSCGVPVVVFATRVSDNEFAEANDLGAAGCVEKPVSFAAFLATVARFASDTRAVPQMHSASPQRDLIVGPTH